jgi:hypothetical protein
MACSVRFSADFFIWKQKNNVYTNVQENINVLQQCIPIAFLLKSIESALLKNVRKYLNSRINFYVEKFELFLDI